MRKHLVLDSGNKLSTLTFGAVCSILTLTASAYSASALTLTSTVPQSGFNGTISSQDPLTSTPYNFTGQSFGALTSIDSIEVRLTINDGDTAPGEFDFNNLTLGLDEIDTGIQLNGFRNNFTDTLTITGVPNNAANILTALQADGQLGGSVIASAIRGNSNRYPNSFNTTIGISGETSTAVPFEFSPGLGILALGTLGGLNQLKRQMQKRKLSKSAFSIN